MKNKVLVIGLDGATWDVIMPYVDQGEMPNIKKLMDSGSWGNLSTVPGKIFPFYEAYQSATAWVSFMTGTTPEKHGVFWFTKKPKNGDPLWWWKKNGDLVSSRDIRVPKIWDILSKKNKKSIVINIPMTYPVQKLNGWMITGFMTPPGKQFTYPLSLERKLKGYTTQLGYKNYVKNYPKVDYRKLMDKMIELLEMRKKILFLMMKNDWDFAVINFKTMDDVLHMFWHFNDVSHPQYDKKLVKKYGNLLLEYHKHVDKILKQILRKIDKNTTLFVISDHGMKSKFREKNIKGKLIRFISILTKQTKKNHIMANHARDGIFIAYGKNIKKTGKIDNKSLMDIAPTALNLYDIKIPEFMDGSPIKEILE